MKWQPVVNLQGKVYLYPHEAQSLLFTLSELNSLNSTKQHSPLARNDQKTLSDLITVLQEISELTEQQEDPNERVSSTRKEKG